MAYANGIYSDDWDKPEGDMGPRAVGLIGTRSADDIEATSCAAQKDGHMTCTRPQANANFSCIVASSTHVSLVSIQGLLS